MGGTVAETIRKEDGTIIKMARKTGAYNWMFFTKEFCEKQFDEAINNHCKIFFEMKEDYENGQPYKYNMSPVYGWCNETAPIDYGLVVIDFMKKKVHSMQGYDNPGFEYISILSPHVIISKDEEQKWDYLISKNLLLVYNEKEKKFQEIETYFKEPMTLAKLRAKLNSRFNFVTSLAKKLIKSDYEDFFNATFFPKELNNFELEVYQETPDGIMQFLKNLIHDDFSFNKAELDSWKERIESMDYEDFFNNEELESMSDDDFETKAVEIKNKYLGEINNLISKSSKLKP